MCFAARQILGKTARSLNRNKELAGKDPRTFHVTNLDSKKEDREIYQSSENIEGL